MTDFDTFVTEHYRDVLRTVALALGATDVAEDATQEAFAKASFRWERVAAMDRPLGWVYVVALNAGRRSLRRRRDDLGRLRVVGSDRSVGGQVAAGPAGTDDHASGIADRVTLAAQLAALPERQRHAVVLRYLGDLSIAETARVLRVTPGTVKASTHAALEKLRITLDEEDRP